MKRAFPPGFQWGVATAGHQVEGDNTTSDTWFLEHVTPSVFREPSGKACDSWHRWSTDLDLAAGLGLTAFRFSVEWARVEPVEGEFVEDALAHYESIVDGCRVRGLAPIVTLNHFTCPHWFAARGGWLDPKAAAWFARYVDRVIARFGDRIAYAVTLNEPNLPRLLAWAGLPGHIRQLERLTLTAAAERAGVIRYRAANVVLPEEFDAIADGMARAHRAARAAIKAQRPDLPVGLALAVVDDRVAGDDPTLRDRKRAEVYGRWLELAREDDFVGVQNYERTWYDASGPVPARSDTPRNQMGSAVEPGSLGGAVRYVYDETHVPVLVTEHGIGTDDDALRAGFIEPSLVGLLDEIDQGVPVLGYCHWTLLDNFEWIFGYAFHYGLFTVDRTTFSRTPKPSAAVYSAIVQSHGLA
jgi:beta-glucosidase